MPTRLKQRLEALENRLSDCSGLVPHSEAWMAYWRDQAHRQVYLHEPGPSFQLKCFAPSRPSRCKCDAKR